ncbi:MAG TPA: PAS domain S-box protein, partial [Bauldia sp.]|nr:PAS domain S-box protein [Bauldia sp.]
MFDSQQLLEALPVAVYTTDAEGRITYYNAAAAALWGQEPPPGSRWCGSWRLYWPDGRPMAHDECPMAATLKEGEPVRGRSAILERPDGTRIAFVPYPTLIRDESGAIAGAINILMDIEAQQRSELEAARLAAIVECSDDAIISKDLQGRVTSWNASATRIFGYQPEEMIGQSITRIIPPELRSEEDMILAKLSRGERIDHFETVRVAKDGRRLDISVTVSPLRNKAGRIIGASKIARDITERKQAAALQRLLFEELNHRVKNTLATIQAIANQSLRRAASPADFVSSFGGRIHALARAHDLLVRSEMKGSDIADVIREQVLLGPPPDPRIACSGPSVMLDSRASVHLALVLHELATNARKYGALSTPLGKLTVDWRVEATDPELYISWREEGVPQVSAPSAHGFGTTLIERTLESNGGEASIRYEVGGVVCDMRLPLPKDHRPAFGEAAPVRFRDSGIVTGPRSGLLGKHILIIEDEPVVAMDLEATLTGAGCRIAGIVSSVGAAMQALEQADVDAALLDANLGGEPVDEVAARLQRKGVPFAFATGHGRDALPEAFREAPVLIKPFDAEQVLQMVQGLVGR